MATISLPPADYYRLRWMQAEAETAAARAETALQAYHVVLHDMARAYGFDASASYQWDNRACALVYQTSAMTDEHQP